MGVVQDIKIMGQEEHPNKYEEIVNGLKYGTYKDIIFINVQGYQLLQVSQIFVLKGDYLNKQRKNTAYLDQNNFSKSIIFINIQRLFMIFVKILISLNAVLLQLIYLWDFYVM